MLDRLAIERTLAWTGDRPVLVALSGGGDSVALLHLLADELGAARLRAAVVDHALREGSAGDAQRAAASAQALNVPVEILTLRWESGANRGQQAARNARYRLICEYARAEGLNAIATAHTADDQAETVLMRAASGSTWRGLAGVAPFAFAPVWPEGRGIAVTRPVLGARREALRRFLRDQRAVWVEDPANADWKFERVRVRQRLAALEAEGFEPERLVRLAARLRRRSAALDTEARRLIAAAATIEARIELEPAKWTDAPGEVRRRALAALVAAASGASREPSPADLDVIDKRVLHCDFRRFTHSGVEFTKSASGLVLQREAGAVLGRADGASSLAPLALPANSEVIWDGRLGITALAPGWRVVPDRNRELHAFKKGPDLNLYPQAPREIRVRSLAAERVAHAFAPDINPGKP